MVSAGKKEWWARGNLFKKGGGEVCTPKVIWTGGKRGGQGVPQKVGEGKIKGGVTEGCRRVAEKNRMLTVEPKKRRNAFEV